MENPLEQIQKAHPGHLHSIWKAAQSGNLESLSEEDRRLAAIMLEHEEYHDRFETADQLHDHEHDAKPEVNPFLHVIFHQIIENQLSSREPIEAFQFFNTMRKNKVSRHDTIHCLAMILTFLVHDVVRVEAPFDLERYKSLLRRYKDKKPDKIEAALQREFPE